MGYLSDEPVVMGGWRFTQVVIPGAVRPAEIKRMFVRGDRRGLGLARRMLAALEADAANAGADWMVLETGSPQVAAVALYRSSGYADIERFGYYADEPDALNLGRPLPRPSGSDALKSDHWLCLPRRVAAEFANWRSFLRARGLQATWKERLARPIWKSSMTMVGGCPGSVAAPKVTNSGV